MFIEGSSRSNVFFLFFSTHGRFAVMGAEKQKERLSGVCSVYNMPPLTRFGPPRSAKIVLVQRGGAA